MIESCCVCCISLFICKGPIIVLYNQTMIDYDLSPDVKCKVLRGLLFLFFQNTLLALTAEGWCYLFEVVAEVKKDESKVSSVFKNSGFTNIRDTYFPFCLQQDLNNFFIDKFTFKDTGTVFCCFDKFCILLTLE